MENDPFVKNKVWKQGTDTLGIRTEKRGALFGTVVTGTLFHVMISIKQVKPAPFIKTGHQPEYVAVDFNDLFHPPVFPKLIPISKLDIGKTMVEIIGKRCEIQVLIFQEIVSRTAITTMAVTDDGIAGSTGQGEDGSAFKGFG